MERLPAEVTTERLTLRRWRVDDVPALGDAIRTSLEHLRPWMAFAALEPLDDEARVELIGSWDEEWAAGGDTIFGVFCDGAVVGGCGWHRRRGPTVLEIGYWIHVDHVRQGFATELARGLTGAAFAIEGIDRVEIHHDKANVRSGAVPRSLGFTAGVERPDEIAAPAEIGIDCTWFVERAAWLA
jgi:RimJ/RimL family protein N-acetyltransferase